MHFISFEIKKRSYYANVLTSFLNISTLFSVALSFCNHCLLLLFLLPLFSASISVCGKSEPVFNNGEDFRIR